MEGFVIENGRPNFEICARCGQAIKNVSWFRGKPYGCECIEVVTGRSLDQWVRSDGVIDETATIERDNARAKKHSNELAAAKIRAEHAEELRAKAATHNEWLILELQAAYQSAFVRSIMEDLAAKPFVDGNFSERCARIVSDIIGVGHGRRGSKKISLP